MISPTPNLNFEDRMRLMKNMHAKPFVVWLTGLSGAGKTSIAVELEQALLAQGLALVRLDGDVLRKGLCRDLGFTPGDRAENIRRAAEVCGLLLNAGQIVLAAFISPFAAERAQARALIEPHGRFYEVFVDTPLAVAEQRDVKGLYRKARLGEISHFTGIDSPYEAPTAPDLHLYTHGETPQQSAARVLAFMAGVGGIGVGGMPPTPMPPTPIPPTPR
ncbi:adenylyl-sulfate kinase [Gammaproteobacteria bacterium LSUCC0112]|nr:adenylyl-sulfate kinase [Gammaproteobacteria bacterium LSUCC0112]